MRKITKAQYDKALRIVKMYERKEPSFPIIEMDDLCFLTGSITVPKIRHFDGIDGYIIVLQELLDQIGFKTWAIASDDLDHLSIHHRADCYLSVKEETKENILKCINEAFKTHGNG